MLLESAPHVRLDQYICSLALEGLESRSQLKRLKVQVFKDEKPLKLSHLVEDGEQLQIRWQEKQGFDANIAVPMDLKILYEDEDIVLLDKPQGLAVHGAASLHEPNLVQGLCARYQNFTQCFENFEEPNPNQLGHEFLRPGIVHRLDKDTSGVLVVARHTASLRCLSEQFAARQVKKTYYAITHGRPSQMAGRIELPLMRSPKTPQHYTTYEPSRLIGLYSQSTANQGKVATGKVREALTEYEVVHSWQVRRVLPGKKNQQIFEQQQFSLLRLQPKTGRTHQIRVHLKHLGCPIVGDPIYGKVQLDSELANALPNLGLMLHAFRLEFCHPNTFHHKDGQTNSAQHTQRAQAPTPAHFRKLLHYLAQVQQR